jgi:alpha-methylacyl-CoA racemase
MRADFATAFATRVRDDWVDDLGPADTCVSAVYDIPELTEDPQFAARNGFVDVEHPVEGHFRQVGGLLAGQVDATQQPIADMSDTQTVEVLEAAGFDPADIADLISEGVLA